jgi:antitoxin MazE
MLAKVHKWGNSQGVRLSKSLLSEAQLEVGDEIDVAVSDGKIILAPIRRVRGRLKLEELVSRIPDDFEPGEVDWGAPEGKEVW